MNTQMKKFQARIHCRKHWPNSAVNSALLLLLAQVAPLRVKDYQAIYNCRFASNNQLTAYKHLYILSQQSNVERNFLHSLVRQIKLHVLAYWVTCDQAELNFNISWCKHPLKWYISSGVGTVNILKEAIDLWLWALAARLCGLNVPERWPG